MQSACPVMSSKKNLIMLPDWNTSNQSLGNRWKDNCKTNKQTNPLSKWMKCILYENVGPKHEFMSNNLKAI